MSTPASPSEEPISDIVQTVKGELARAKDELDRARLVLQTQRASFEKERENLKQLSKQLRESIEALVSLRNEMQNQDKLPVTESNVVDSLVKEIAAMRSELAARAETIRQSFVRLNEATGRLKNELGLLRKSAEAPIQARRNCPHCGRGLSGGEFFCDACGQNLAAYLV